MKPKILKTKIKLPYIPAKTVANAITIIFEPKIKKSYEFPVAKCDIQEGVVDYYLPKNIKKIIDWHVDMSSCGRKLKVNER